jgi:hypothetical protein
LTRRLREVQLDGPIVSLQKLQGQLRDKGALETVAHYLALLQGAYLVAPLEKFSQLTHRRRASPPKVAFRVVCNFRTCANKAFVRQQPQNRRQDSKGRQTRTCGKWRRQAPAGFPVR